jgi:hypothetical protein
MATLARLRIHPAVTHWRTTLAILLAALALGAGVLAGIGYVGGGVSEPVVVAARALPPGTRLRAEDLRVVQVARMRPAAWRGVPDPRLLIGAYTRTPLAPDQVVQPDQVQASSPDAAVVWPDGKAGDGLPEVVQGVVFELKRDGLRSVAVRNRVNIIALVDPQRGADPSFSLGALDRPGSGARAVRVLRQLRVLGVTDRAVMLDVTPEQSRYLWALAAAEVPFVGELSAADAAEAPLGPLPPSAFGIEEHAGAPPPAPAAPRDSDDRPGAPFDRPGAPGGGGRGGGASGPPARVE